MTIALQDAPSAEGSRRKRPFAALAALITLLDRSIAAANAYESMSQMTDAELARRGLTRADIPAVAKRVLLDEE